MIQKKRDSIALFCAIVLVTSVGLVHAQPSQIVEERMRIKSMVGTVMIRTPKNQKWRAARVGMMLRMKWDIRTYVESSAEIEYGTGTIIRIGENSVITLSRALRDKDVSATKTSVDIATGQVWANVKKLVNKKSQFDFETPTATAAIRGTRLGIKVGRGKTRIDVYEGLVMVRKRGSARGTQAGQFTRVVVEADVPEPVVTQFTRETAADTSSLAGREPMIDPFSAGTAHRDTGTVSAVQDTGAPQDTGIGELGGDQDATEGADTADTSSSPDDTSSQPGIDSLDMDDDDVELGLEILYPTQGQIFEEAQVMVTGLTSPDALATINGQQAAVGSDGAFAGVVELSLGSNTIPVSVRLGDAQASENVAIDYRPPLVLGVGNIVDGMEVASEVIDLDVQVTDGARFSVNGVEGQTRVALAPGANHVAVAAWDEWGNTEQEDFEVILTRQTEFSLQVVSPEKDAVVVEPVITVSGSTTPGAQVEVNGSVVAVGSSGFFTHKVHIPDEEGDYIVTVNAEHLGEQLSVDREVTYESLVEPLTLAVTSPVGGQLITTRSIRVSGMTGPHAEVLANGHRVGVSPAGVFSGDIQVTERDAGDFVLEIVARSDAEELEETIDLIVDAASPQINTSAPVLMVQGLSNTTRSGEVSLRVQDGTPEDRVTVVVTLNGTMEEYLLESGGTERLSLDEGANTYRIRATDLAQNASNMYEGEILYLPGPLTLDIIEPSNNPYVIRGLPPMPTGVEDPILEIEVEVDDGIGDLPETIRYCRIRGSGREVLLTDNKDYIYTGEIELPPGQTSTFTITAEDVAGNVVSKTLTVRFLR